jgi:2,3-bisphosphoglycerate-independent phosphoglycerate mutase
MTQYRDDFDFPVAFPEHVVEAVLADVLSANGVRQLHAAETEKYAHVTYFLDGGREEPFAGEERILVSSPRDVPSYDHKPEMSAEEVADRIVGAIEEDGYGFVVVNFANADMVGHTGVIPAVVEAVETTDECLGKVVYAVDRAGGVSLVIADHGNAENLLQEDGVSPHTAHTTNPVPAILTAPGTTLRDGELADVAPTVLALLGLEAPLQMTGTNLVQIR